LVDYYLNDGVWISDGSAVTGVDEGYPLGTRLDLPHPAQLVLGLLGGDAVHDETALHVVQQTEVLACFVDLNDILEASGKLFICPRLTVDLYEPLLHDGLDLFDVQGVLETVPEEQRDGERLRELVRSRAGPDREHSSQLVQHPRLGGVQTLQMLLRTTGHCEALNFLKGD